MIMIAAASLGVAAVLTAVFTVLCLKGKKKQSLTVLAVMFLASAAVNIIGVKGEVRRDRYEFSTYGNHLSESVRYTETKGGYHLFEDRSVGSSDKGIAVPDSIELPGYIRNIDKSRVTICSERDTELKRQSSLITVDGKEYYLADKAEKLRPDYEWLMMWVCIAFLIPLEVTCIVCLAGKKKKQ
ncbi:MAG: hypothetical protein IKP95_07150 [Ruminococcus sp.]|nr:hypothetical protein [Ruminococcus sp.]